MRNIRVVVIDDSAYNRRTITKMLEGVENVQVVGYAADGEEGVRKIIDLKPDLVTLDLEMPRMDGFTLLRIVMSYCPTPVIVISAKSGDDKVFRALEFGAVDFIAKPSSAISEELLTIAEDLQRKVRGVFQLNLAGVVRREPVKSQPPPERVKKKPAPLPAREYVCPVDVVAIGAS